MTATKYPRREDSKLLGKDGLPAYAILYPMKNVNGVLLMTKEYADVLKEVAEMVDEDKETVANALTAYLKLADSVGYDLRDHFKVSHLHGNSMTLPETSEKIMDTAADISRTSVTTVANCVVAFYLLWEKRGIPRTGQKGMPQ